jgi:hypothetical protein
MIENNPKNINYSDSNDILYKPDNQIKKSVSDLLLFSLSGDYPNLKELLDEKDFLGSTMNLALRNLLSNNFNNNDPNFLNCYKYLLKSNIDLNYKFTKDNNSTILMKVSKTGQLILMKELLESFNAQLKNMENMNKFQKPEEEKEYLLIQNEIFLTQKDNNNSNFLHYMKHFNKCENQEIFEYLYEEYPFEQKRNKEDAKKIQEIIKNLIKQKNDEGNNFMNICLLHGMPYLVLKIIEIIGYIPNLNKKNNNYIHSAILGGNMTCLKIILYYSNYNDLNEKNSDLLTPAQLAYKMGYTSMSNLILEYQENFQDEIYKEYFFKNLEHYNKSSNVNYITNINNNKFKQIIYELKEMKIINNLCDTTYLNKVEEDLDFKISSIKIDWNLLLTKIKQYEFEPEKDFDINMINSINNNKSGKTNKKKCKKIEDKNKNSIYPFLKLLFEFNENIFSNKLINSFIDNIPKEQNLIENNKSIDILLFNKIIFYYNTGHYKSLLNIAYIYLSKIYQKEKYNINTNSNSNNRTLIIYINITCIIIEILIYLGHQDIVDIIIKVLDNYLYTKSLNLGDVQYKSEDEIIFDYLNRKEILNPFISNWKNLFSYSNFLKLINDKSRDNLDDFKKKIDESKDKKMKPINYRYHILFDCLDIKKAYDKNSYDIYNKIERFYSKKYLNREIYYLNILGIIFMKKKKFTVSIIFFQKGLKRYMNILKNKNAINSDEKFFSFRIDYITAFLYNISLCKFYLKEYHKCIKILELLLTFDCNKNNYFLFFRLALCYLEIYIKCISNNDTFFNLNINKVIGYENNKNNNIKIKNDKSSTSINIDNESSENLSGQFESKDNVTKGTDDIKQADLIDKNLVNLFLNYSYYNYNENNETNIKKIILRNTKQNIVQKKSDSDINEINSYLERAIKYLKKILNINKINVFSNSIKSIYEFFFSHIKDDINIKDISHKNKKIQSDLILNTYLNILFCLSLKNNWLEMLLTIKDFNSKKIITTKTNILKVLLFQLEANVNLNRQNKIIETINKIKNYKKNEFSVFNQSNKDIIKNINIKLYLYYSLTLIYYRDKNYKEMEIYSNKLLSLITKEKDIPYYIIDLLINVFIIKLNNESNINPINKYKYNNIILNLIKNKKKINID